MAGTIGLVQNDIKRVLAYSTVSQLGYMFLAMGVGAYGAGIFHLYTHAFFKALLFLGSGAVIHALGGEQDLRRMGGLRRALPITYWTFLIGALAIAGVPGFAGFFSKDHVLFMTYMSGHTVLWAIGLLTALLTAVYMFRVVFLAFHGPSRSGATDDAPGHHGHGPHLHDAPPAMAIALIVLAAGSVVAGYFGTSFEQFLEPSFGAPVAELGADAHAIELTLMAVSTVVAVAGIGLSVVLFLKRRDVVDRLAERFAAPRRLLERKYYVDEIYDAAVVQPIRIVSEQGLWKIVDVKVIDGAVNGVATGVQGAGALLRRLQTGSVRAYAASLLLGVVVVMGYYLWR
jgi:NADH-quinone oxidoreductase subunit L